MLEFSNNNNNNNNSNNLTVLSKHKHKHGFRFNSIKLIKHFFELCILRASKNNNLKMLKTCFQLVFPKPSNYYTTSLFAHFLGSKV
jgi:hypothetical protein